MLGPRDIDLRDLRISKESNLTTQERIQLCWDAKLSMIEKIKRKYLRKLLVQIEEDFIIKSY